MKLSIIYDLCRPFFVLYIIPAVRLDDNTFRFTKISGCITDKYHIIECYIYWIDGTL